MQYLTHTYLSRVTTLAPNLSPLLAHHFMYQIHVMHLVNHRLHGL